MDCTIRRTGDVASRKTKAAKEAKGTTKRGKGARDQKPSSQTRLTAFFSGGDVAAKGVKAEDENEEERQERIEVRLLLSYLLSLQRVSADGCGTGKAPGCL